MQFAGKVAFVTGAGSGIGKAAALLLAEEGAKVALLSRTASQLEAVAVTIRQNGGEALVLTADISQPNEMEAAIEAIGDAWGRLDIVVANAGINGMWAPIADLTPEEWDQTQEINLKGTFLTVKYALPYLKREGGTVVIVSSVNGTRMFSNSGGSAYATSKAGQVAFAKMAALELAHDRIRVNVICPGAVTTEIRDNTYFRDRESVRQKVVYEEGNVPLTGGIPASSEQVAQLILFLVSDASSHITGTEMWIDGAQSLLQG